MALRRIPDWLRPAAAGLTYLSWGVVAGLSYWVLDSLFMAYALGERTFSEQMLSPTRDEYWERAFVFALFVVVGWLVGTLTDRRRKAQEAATLAGRLLMEALESLPDGLAVYDSDETLQLFNRKFFAAFPDVQHELQPGLKLEEVLRTVARSKYSHTARRRPDDWVQNRLVAHRQGGLNVEIVLDDGRRVLARDNRTTDGGMLCIRTDVTEQRRLEEQLVDIANREQMRIGHDLHDNVAQQLTGVTFLLKGLEPALQNTSGLPRMRQALDLLSGSLTNIRKFSEMLLPVEIGTGELPVALERLAERSRGMFAITCDFRCECYDSTCSPDQAHHLYRIAQETVTNAAKHASASRIVIRCREDGKTGSLSVIDDGVGIADSGARDGGLGIRIMEYRARLVGGSLNVEPGPEGGTTVHCNYKVGYVIDRTSVA